MYFCLKYGADPEVEGEGAQCEGLTKVECFPVVLFDFCSRSMLEIAKMPSNVLNPSFPFDVDVNSFVDENWMTTVASTSIERASDFLRLKGSSMFELQNSWGSK